MKLMAAGVTFSAAIVKSPSFSRSSSSTTMTIRPARNASTASSIRANGPCAALRAPLAIFMLDPIAPRALRTSMPDLLRTHTMEGQPRKLRGSHHVFPDHVALEVDAIPFSRALQVRMVQRERHDHHVESIRPQSSHRQTDAVDGDRSAMNDVGRERGGKADRQPVEVGLGPQILDVTDGVNVALDEMAAQPAVGAQRTLEIHPGAA